MANNLNISSVVSPDILKTVSSSSVIKTFGDQLKDKGKEKIISVALGKTQQITDQIQEVVTLEIQVRSDHNTELKRLEILLKENQITQEEYDKLVLKENEAFEEELKTLEQLKLKLQQDLKNILNDPYSKIKDNQKKRKARRAVRKARTKAEKTKAKRDQAKKVATNISKTLAPVLALQLANKFSSITSQRQKLEILVDQVNSYIDSVQTPDQVTIATNLRNNTITLINSSINKLKNLQDILKTINVTLTIFNLLIPLLNRAAPLTVLSTPPFTPIITMVAHDEIRNKKQRLERLVSALSIILSVANISLENEINELNALILKLKNVDLNSLDQQQLNALSNLFLPTNTEFEMYKGFKFSIKTEENKAFEVKGNKRKYAVAIDRDGVEVLKSEFSFTLDPQDLVDQLKIVIDQRNLQG